MRRSTIAASLVVSLGLLCGRAIAGQAPIGERTVQIASVDLEAQVIEVHNFGDQAQPLDGWRFCTHDDNQNRQYSSFQGLNGITLAPGASLFVHLLDDASGPDAIDAPGPFATPIDPGPYAIGLYFSPVNFSNGNTLADHLQWSRDGTDDTTADERTDEAVAGGVWEIEEDWIATDEASTRIVLLEGAESLQPNNSQDYEVVPEPGTALLQLAGLAALSLRARPCRKTGPDPVRG